MSIKHQTKRKSTIDSKQQASDPNGSNALESMQDMQENLYQVATVSDFSQENHYLVDVTWSVTVA